MLKIILAGGVVLGSALAAAAIGTEFRKDRVDYMMAVAYSCGYLAGQHAIMTRLPETFPAASLPPEFEWCKVYRENAERHAWKVRNAD